MRHGVLILVELVLLNRAHPFVQAMSSVESMLLAGK